MRRNIRPFPADFASCFTAPELVPLMSQIATSKKATGAGARRRSRSQIAILKKGRGQNIKYLPHAFTAHGAIQAANVLNCQRAVAMGVHVVRAFVCLRDLLASNKALNDQLNDLERKYLHHDKAIATILATIRGLLASPGEKRRGIGFTADID